MINYLMIIVYEQEKKNVFKSYVSFRKSLKTPKGLIKSIMISWFTVHSYTISLYICIVYNKIFSETAVENLKYVFNIIIC